MSSWVDVKKEPVTEQHLELKKDLSLNVEGLKRFAIFRGKVTEKGSEWNLLEAAAYITFHKGAVPKPSFFTCSVLPPKLCCPSTSGDELLVSNVIELSHDGPPDLELSGDGFYRQSELCWNRFWLQTNPLSDAPIRCT